jgi:electron transfer flavoprotein beta subunit
LRWAPIPASWFPTLAAAIRKLGAFDLILCGKQASDGDTAQVGPGIATQLDLPQITYVRKIEALSETEVTAERLLETGYEVITAPLPCLLTVIKEINEPRLPSLKGKLAARKAAITTWSAVDIKADAARIGLDGSPTKVVNIFTPPPREGGTRLTGEPEAMVAALVEKLRDAVLSAAS